MTNPSTRHLTVTPSAAATSQRESGGRASLGIGKGDSALSQIGLDALTVREFEEVGAYLNVAVDSGLTRAWLSEEALQRWRGSRTGAAYLSAVTGRGIRVADSGYETDRHGDAQAGFARELEGEFIDRYAIAGTPEVVRARLERIRACQTDCVIVVPGSLDSDPDTVMRSCERFAREVIARPSRRHGRPARNASTSITNQPGFDSRGASPLASHAPALQTGLGDPRALTSVFVASESSRDGGSDDSCWGNRSSGDWRCLASCCGRKRSSAKGRGSRPTSANAC